LICKICKGESAFFSEARILNKYEINYFKCANCGFLQTEEPYWLKESYEEVINKSDVGYVGRNIILSKVTKLIINYFFSIQGKFLDYGGGYGLFVRLMRDSGFDFYWQDNYCENLFAKGFETRNSGTNDYEMVTGFELFEHFENPITEIEKMFNYSKNIFISTYLFPDNNPKPQEWWYYGLEHGQHISLYSYAALEFIAKKYSLNIYSNRKNLHLLTSKKINPLMFKYVNIKNIYYSLKSLSNKKSLHDKDYNYIIGIQKNKS
jgi:hypothetical protein